MNEEDNDDVAPPSQHSASVSVESESDSRPTNAHSCSPKIVAAICSGIRNSDYFRTACSIADGFQLLVE
jgi:hypothetical protein